MLVGRDVLLNACDRALDDARRGRGRLLLLAGEAGIGKTTLAGEVVDRGVSTGAVMRAGACWETEALPPYTPWLQALRHPASERASAAADALMGGDHAATDQDGAQRALGRRFTEVIDALRHEASAAPQIVLLEDLHWADESSIELLTAVAAHLPTMPVLVIGTYRADELPQGGAFASIGGNAERIWLGGLDDLAVSELLETCLGRVPSATEVAHVQRQTSGNPLFVTQVGRLLDGDGRLSPSGIRDVIDRRLARLSTACNKVLGAASVLGADFDGSTLVALAGADARDRLAEAVDAGLLVLVDDELDSWRFVHALVRGARYDQLSGDERATLHHAALDALASRRDTPAAVLAHHATRARFDDADTRPAELLVAAGTDALARLAWSDAVASFERALALVPDSDAGRRVCAEAWLGIGSARLRTGQDDVRAAFDAAAALARQTADGDLLARAALGFSVGLGAFEVRLVDRHQIDLLDEAAGVLTDDDPVLPLVLARLSVSLAFVESTERRVQLAERGVALARRGDDPVVLGHALAAWCDSMAEPRAVDERATAAVEIIDLARRANDLPLELLGRRLRLVALLEQNDLAAADLEIGAYERAAELLGDPLYTWYGHLWRGMRAHSDGDFAEVDRRLQLAAEVGEEGSSVNAVVLTTVLGGMAAIDRRDRVRADEMVATVREMLPGPLSPWVSCIIAYLEAHFGDHDRARAALAQITSEHIADLPRDSEWLCSMVQLAFAASRVDDHRVVQIVRPLIAEVGDVCAVEGIGAYLHGSAHRFLGLLAAMDSDVGATREHVDASLAATAGRGRLIEALAQLDGARALQRAADPHDAQRVVELASAARTTFEAIGLDGLASDAAAFDGAGPTPSVPVPSNEPALVRHGDVWAWTWADTTVQVRHAKGVADLALLLERAGREVHVRELEGATAPGTSGPQSHQDVLDEEAVRQYRQRLSDLEDELDEADRFGDSGRAEKLAAERDALVDELTAAFGIGGRARRAGSDPDERLRKAVSARVRASIDRIDGLHPGLGTHLRRSVRTGFWCAYEPETSVVWRVERS